MTDRQPGAPGDEPTPDIEPEATEVAAVPETGSAEPESAVAPESADDEMAEDADAASGPAHESELYEEPSPEDFEDEAESEDQELTDEELDDESAIGADADGEILEAAAGAGATAGRGSRLGGRLTRTPAAPLTPSERAVHISDRASQVFVIAATLTFVGILLYALFAGAGGFLAPVATPSPSVEVSESPSESASPSSSVSPSTSGSASPSASGTAAPSKSASPSSAGPSPSAS